MAALIHAGWLIAGYQHREAKIAESVIAAALLVWLIVVWMLPKAVRTAGLAAQIFALFGTCVRMFTMIVGVGPRMRVDIVYPMGSSLSGVRPDRCHARALSAGETALRPEGGLPVPGGSAVQYDSLDFPGRSRRTRFERAVDLAATRRLTGRGRDE